jgi:hypothetical protein
MNKISSLNLLRFGLVYGIERHFQQYFSHIVEVSFIGGGDPSTQRKPLTAASH